MPPSAGAGACDHVNIMQCNTVLCIVLSHKKKKKNKSVNRIVKCSDVPGRPV